MKILIADPPNLGNQWLIANHPNLGALYLLSYRRERVKDADIFYIDVHAGLEEHIERVKSIKPDIYGLSFSVMREKDAFQTIREIRARFHELTIICGGPYPTVMAEHILRELPVDICVIGEGELTMAELSEALRDRQPLDNIPGLAFRKNSRIVTTEKRKLIPKIDIRIIVNLLRNILI